MRHHPIKGLLGGPLVPLISVSALHAAALTAWMAPMPDMYNNFGTDLSASPSGDLLTVGGTVLGQQRVLRRLLTNRGEYLWHVGYGAGLPQFIGQPASAAQIQGIVQQQMLLEEVVAQMPPPSVSVSYYPDGTFFVSISYTDAQTGTPLLLEFDVNT